MPRNFFLAPALRTLRQQINEANPGRDITSDGWIGDLSHRNRKSDHNPNSFGAVTAIDVDENLSPGKDAAKLVEALQASRDPRIKYIIYEGRITVPSDITRWKKYKGQNPHNHHFHISVSSNKSLWSDSRLWDLTKSLADPVAVTYRQGDKGAGVKEVQKRLVFHKFLDLGEDDGDFGQRTFNAVIAFQKARRLPDDGIVGQATRNELFK